jgi:hypothetical protein
VFLQQCCLTNCQALPIDLMPACGRKPCVGFRIRASQQRAASTPVCWPVSLPLTLASSTWYGAVPTVAHSGEASRRYFVGPVPVMGIFGPISA